ncbi:hypothetical protein ZEAMMB73_Zm00001d005059 [Zea mays]|uniref:Uncharacterized protein n=1 Tax=Zea mays TaxID=4577 RepID=A0A1D6EJ05_MAIZE|nr:hypothetical protein ZEAMMB73_Zm00001d005059 [Zea mays]ONM20074.1 hypothetical protein ZEAMMB73_Zm00001d005059 [Zea mays]ONM20078.1 hypothetical protein ZEAMMB73_Zm00001d005059 [Zea mays]
MIIYRLMRAYISSSSLRKSALRALAKALTTDQLFNLREQFTLFGPNKSGHISLQNMKTALMKNSSGAMNDSRILDFVNSICNIQYGMIDFEEFSATAISVYQMEGLETWEEHAQQAYELFDKVGKGLLKDENAQKLALQHWLEAAALEEILYQFEEKLQAEREEAARKQEELQAQLQAQQAALEENQSLLRQAQEEVKGMHTKFEETNALLRAVLKLQKD